MGFVFDVTAANQISKEIYTPKDIEILAFESPFVGMIPKWPGGGGLQYTGAIGNSVLTSVSSQDTLAFTAGSASSYERFVCQWKQGFASANLSGIAIDQTRTDKGAMVKAITQEMDNGYKALGQQLGRTLYGNGGGAIGLVNGVAATTTYVAGDTIVLTNVNQAVNFQKNQIINAALTNGTTGTPLSGAVTLVAVNLITGALTANVAWASGIQGFTTACYLFNQGDFGNYMPGLAGWLPDSANRPTATDNFNNVNRSTDPVRLAGVYINGNSQPMEETLIDAVLQGAKFGGKNWHMMINPFEFGKLSKSLTGKVIYTSESAFENPDIAFPSITINSPAGPVKLVQDPYCNGPLYNDAYLVDLDEWVLPSMGEVPKNLTEETTGLIWIPQPGSNAFISQLGYRATMYCAAPGHQVVVTF
jgi:hypothetical protein